MPKSEMVTVEPSPKLRPTEYLPGIGVEGKTMSRKEAQPLLDAKLVTIKVPAKAVPAISRKEA